MDTQIGYEQLRYAVDSQLLKSDSIRICTKSDLGWQSERGLSYTNKRNLFI